MGRQEGDELPLLVMKACTKCGETKPLTDFYLKGKGYGDQRHTWCKECAKARIRERYASDPIYRERSRKSARKSHLKTVFGISVEEYDAMLEAQGGVCAMCGAGRPASSRIQNWPVDHHHGTGQLRKLLCVRCNTGLAYIEDDEFMSRARAYLVGS